MKKLLLLTFAGICAFTAYGQTAEFSVRAGYNIINHRSTEGVMKFRSGMNAGILTDIKINDRLFFQPGVVYSLKKSRYLKISSGMLNSLFPDNDVLYNSLLMAKSKIHYIEIPLSIGFKIQTGGKSSLVLNTGPYISFALSKRFDYATAHRFASNFEIDEYLVNKYLSEIPYLDKNILSDTDLGWNFGVSYRYGNLFAGVQYAAGFKPLCSTRYSRDINLKLYTSTLSLNIGYYLWKTK